MKIGLSMLFCLNRPFSYLLAQLEKAEVESIELVDEGLHALNSRRIDALKRVIHARNLQVTVHAPFVDINLASLAPSIRKAMLKQLKKSLQLSSQLNPSLWVFHPGLQGGVSDIYPGLDWEINLKSVRELLDTAKQYGVKIVIENVPEPFPFLLKSVEDFTRFYADLGEADLDLALDVAHANINGQIYEFLDKFGGKIVHTHLHDNHGNFDDHLGIGDGNVNWPNIIQAFKKINYKGSLTIESKKNIEESLKTLRKLIQNA